MSIHQIPHKFADLAAKNIARVAAPTIGILGLEPVRKSIESYTAFVGGKGAGSGWDNKGEIRAISSRISSDNPVIFDVGANNGNWSKALSKRLGNSNTKFYLFECSPH